MTGNVQLYLTEEGITRGGSNTGWARTEWDGGMRSSVDGNRRKRQSENQSAAEDLTMILESVRVQNYRSIKDTGWVDIEDLKTILVGPNEAGKTALLQAIQHLNRPSGVKPLSPLRDFPRSEYAKIKRGEIDPADVRVVEGKFRLEYSDLAELPAGITATHYFRWRNLDDSTGHRVSGAAERQNYGTVKADLARLALHADQQAKLKEITNEQSYSAKLAKFSNGWSDYTTLMSAESEAIKAFLDEILAVIDENDQSQLAKHEQIMKVSRIDGLRNKAVANLQGHLPLFVLFNNYFRVRPLIHLGQLANRIANSTLDEERFDYGNVCLLKLLGFEAMELSQMGTAADPAANDPDGIDTFREKLDERQYLLNAAEVDLTQEIRSIWNPDEGKGEAAKVRLRADGQYLKVSVEDALGVEVELDQRSEGFQWLVSFFVVFFAEAKGKHDNAILLLDEPGVSLHALKQREFQKTISRLSENNQTIYTTHSPFMIGADELDLVRVVEMKDRKEGTKVHTSITASDAAALLPLQEALGYDLAQSLFTQKRNLVTEGLTDYWYLEAANNLLSEAGKEGLNPLIALVPASGASKVVYFATILHAQGLKVAALLDSDSAGDTAAKQDSLVGTLGAKRILRTKDYMAKAPKKCEIEDLFRATLVKVAKSDLGWDIEEVAKKQKDRSIISIFEDEISDFSKYRLAKAFVRWSRDNTYSKLLKGEQTAIEGLVAGINTSLK